jgi:hypothetical protein
MGRLQQDLILSSNAKDGPEPIHAAVRAGFSIKALNDNEGLFRMTLGKI